MLERSVANKTSTLTTQRRPGAEDPTAVDLVTRILEYAAVSRASDIHIEPYELEAIIRYRIDGTLQEVSTWGSSHFFLPPRCRWSSPSAWSDAFV
jgi:type II secretory ATPase GspE/PulE/Tfp pilus assembly ATPase PilB-like protein